MFPFSNFPSTDPTLFLDCHFPPVLMKWKVSQSHPWPMSTQRLLCLMHGLLEESASVSTGIWINSTWIHLIEITGTVSVIPLQRRNFSSEKVPRHKANWWRRDSKLYNFVLILTHHIPLQCFWSFLIKLANSSQLSQSGASKPFL